jgi:hypothetical protein
VKLAVIVDDFKVQRFGLDALDAIAGVDEFTVFSCTNTRLPKHWLRHAGYYALNLLTVRNRLTRYVPIASGRKKVTTRKEFVSDYEGAWQVLPQEIIQELNAFDVVLKFGMGLLRVPSELSTSILSYHHGDPDRYRGRPAGFWEMVEDSAVMGQVIQVIGNKLDAGKVVAYAETKIFPWSYRATLLESYRHSPLIIDTAIRNAIAGSYLTKASDGRNCGLPSNVAVVAFALRMIPQKLRRLFYGAFRDKAWNVSTARRRSAPFTQSLPHPTEWKTLRAAAAYAFYADPFYSGDGILVEALNRRSRLGEIVRINDHDHQPVIVEPGHISYPGTLEMEGRQFVVPETASWSRPRLYQIGPTGAEQVGEFRIEGDVRVSDPTIIQRDGRLYLFGNDRKDGSNVLKIWTADSLESEFKLHPKSPIRISPEGSRMGGNFVKQESRLYRLGQDFTRDYGDGLIVFEVNELSPDAYSESLAGRIRLSDRKGPHTLNVRGDEVVFDWYRDRFSLLAGVRRLQSLLQRRRPQATQ